MDNFKAIETLHSGYRFRSRLEARWACFFEALGIEYHYEPEGYAMEGVAYLPDFYLPLQNNFVEIKPQTPSIEEATKTRLLALYTEKVVYTCFGNVWIPNQPGGYETYSDIPPVIYTYPIAEGLGGISTQIVCDVPRGVFSLIGKLKDADIEVSARRGSLSFSPSTNVYAYDLSESLNEYIEALKDMQATLLSLSPLIAEHGLDMIKVLSPAYGWEREYHCVDCDFNNYAWTECSSCGSLQISLLANKPLSHFDCSKDALLLTDSPRLVSAYVAARSARFGKDGRS